MTTTFCGLPMRWLTLTLAQAIFWQPLWAQAEMLVPNQPGTQVTQAANGVPVLDIATPDAHGLSHNRFDHYNVGPQGLVLNNASAPVVSQLAGAIAGNPHLAGGPAGVILNEVTAANPSQLSGYTEVAGPGARVIVANPYGITCDGCGFINAPRATLSTGRPMFGEDGQLERFSVEGGHILVGGQGLNASNVDRFELLTRAATINAKLYARDLKVVAGRNDIDAQTLVPTPHAGAAEDAPRVAIDSSALGGMYANAIYLVGTEAGVGVHLAGDLIASSGDLHLSADGQLTLARTAASGDLRVQGGDVVLSEAVHAGGNAHLKARGDLLNRGVLSAAGTLALEAGGSLANAGTARAGQALSVSAAHLDNQGGVLESLGNVVDHCGQPRQPPWPGSRTRRWPEQLKAVSAWPGLSTTAAANWRSPAFALRCRPQACATMAVR
ncbi:filamentous hemagglutinin N-terminal domain-containing protein [Pseudomonas sp. KNUC1026]|uniref:filamentous hemagglutinin N-terminal domain-containing protein n=1 Tax=Pseudomonas sp. KNUC1026 TaxID=2893890 RepID=UPI001F47ECAE|nr:filamentous hemagglutinin N-terminal domain-containing protein [Pseudomonas sp. KNUC1026]UFH50129.1 filamentous hemagglutinin N-terminal domain-containing protein [Pseudomonas sp. KNUC1026]